MLWMIKLAMRKTQHVSEGEQMIEQSTLKPALPEDVGHVAPGGPYNPLEYQFDKLEGIIII